MRAPIPGRSSHSTTSTPTAGGFSRSSLEPGSWCRARESERRPTAEVAHEALIRSWGTLKRWIDEDFQFLLWRQRLDVFISEWERTNQDPSALLTGGRLAEARRWQRTHAKGFTDRERRFVAASARHEAGSRAWRWAAAVVLLGAMSSSGYYGWTRTDAYVVRTAIRDAPVRDAAFAGRSDDDPYVETLQDWVAALVMTGRDAAAAEAVSALDNMFDGCARDRGRSPPAARRPR